MAPKCLHLFDSGPFYHALSFLLSESLKINVSLLVFIGYAFRNVLLQTCIHKVPVGTSERGLQWPEQWPLRAEKAPYWLKSSQVGVYGKAAPEDFSSDYEHWKHIVSKSYLTALGINWSSVRNVMDMSAVYGG